MPRQNLDPQPRHLVLSAAPGSGAAAAAWTRAHRAFLELGEVARAARSAFWLGMTQLLRGGHARGGGWLARMGADTGGDVVFALVLLG